MTLLVFFDDEKMKAPLFNIFCIIEALILYMYSIFIDNKYYEEPLFYIHQKIA